jgi:hypothetical protein
MNLAPSRLVAVLALAAGIVFTAPAEEDRNRGLWFGDDNTESPSPEELVPATLEPGLSRLRAIPSLEHRDAPEESGFVPLFRLTRPFYDSVTAIVPPQYLPPPDLSSFRPSTVYIPSIGVRPRIYRPGLFEIYPWFGIAQSFDTNVNLTPTNEITDFYVTPRAGFDFHLGTPDSAWIEGYDSIVALQTSYEAYADLFYLNPDLSAFNQKLEISSRIGRSGAIWRPIFSFSDITGTNLLLVDLVNRTRRIRVSPGLIAQYKFTERTRLEQTFGYFYFGHTDPAYINFNYAQTRQTLSYRVFHETSVLLYGGYRYTSPDRGPAGSEIFVGTGWQGKPDPRLYTELFIGYGSIELDGPPPGARNMGGLRFNGYTTFDWTERFRPTFRYDRDYVFNELDENDNYVSTLLQVKGEIFLGENWYLTPYFGFALNEFQTSGDLTYQIRPELEVAYAFPERFEGNSSRIFVKVGYSHSENIKGSGLPIKGTRISFGAAWKF